MISASSLPSRYSSSTTESSELNQPTLLYSEGCAIYGNANTVKKTTKKIVKAKTAPLLSTFVELKQADISVLNPAAPITNSDLSKTATRSVPKADSGHPRPFSVRTFHEMIELSPVEKPPVQKTERLAPTSFGDDDDYFADDGPNLLEAEEIHGEGEGFCSEVEDDDESLLDDADLLPRPFREEEEKFLDLMRHPSSFRSEDSSVGLAAAQAGMLRKKNSKLIDKEFSAVAIQSSDHKAGLPSCGKDVGQRMASLSRGALGASRGVAGLDISSQEVKQALLYRRLKTSKLEKTWQAVGAD